MDDYLIPPLHMYNHTCAYTRTKKTCICQDVSLVPIVFSSPHFRNTRLYIWFRQLGGGAVSNPQIFDDWQGFIKAVPAINKVDSFALPPVQAEAAQDQRQG